MAWPHIHILTNDFFLVFRAAQDRMKRLKNELNALVNRGVDRHRASP